MPLKFDKKWDVLTNRPDDYVLFVGGIPVASVRELKNDKGRRYGGLVSLPGTKKGDNECNVESLEKAQRFVEHVVDNWLAKLSENASMALASA